MPANSFTVASWPGSGQEVSRAIGPPGRVLLGCVMSGGNELVLALPSEWSPRQWLPAALLGQQLRQKQDTLSSKPPDRVRILAVWMLGQFRREAFPGSNPHTSSTSGDGSILSNVSSTILSVSNCLSPVFRSPTGRTEKAASALRCACSGVSALAENCGRGRVSQGGFDPQNRGFALSFSENCGLCPTRPQSQSAVQRVL